MWCAALHISDLDSALDRRTHGVCILLMWENTYSHREGWLRGRKVRHNSEADVVAGIP